MSAFDICLTQTYFLFNNKFYSQTSSLQMESSLNPLLTDIFISHIENIIPNANSGKCHLDNEINFPDLTIFHANNHFTFNIYRKHSQESRSQQLLLPTSSQNGNILGCYKSFVRFNVMCFCSSISKYIFILLCRGIYRPIENFVLYRLMLFILSKFYFCLFSAYYYMISFSAFRSISLQIQIEPKRCPNSSKN